MNKCFLKQLALIKAELLCYGMRIDKSAEEKLLKVNPFALEKTLVHALHIIVYNTIVNVCVSEKFCSFSPYVLKHINGFCLFREDEELCNVSIINTPFWCEKKIDGYLTGKYLRPHSLNCISCSPILLCGYVSAGKGCKFCSLSEFGNQTENDNIIPKHTLAKMIYSALKEQDYELNISAGTILTKDKSAKYYLSVLKELRSLCPRYFPKVSIEMTPPDDDHIIDELAQGGVNSLILNIEIVDSSLRKELCPGKGSIPLEHYFTIMAKAVKTFGRGNVSSVLLAGIQPADDIIKMGHKLISMGVIPTIMPFKPLDDCQMNDYPRTDPTELLYINKALGKKMLEEQLNPKQQYGCTKCGGCSLEDIFISDF